MLLRISEAVDDVHCNYRVLHRLVNFRFQITGVENIILENSNRIDEILVSRFNM